MKTQGISFDQLASGELEKELSPWDAFEAKFEFLQDFRALRNISGLKLKHLFGGLGFYKGQRLLLVLMEDPLLKTYKNKISDSPLWFGALVPTRFEDHSKLIKICPHLEEHLVLRKWLYLRRSNRAWMPSAKKIMRLILSESPLVGIETKRARKNTAKRLRPPTDRRH